MDAKPITQELLTAWADSCQTMSHLGTLIQRELKPTRENARAIVLCERARLRAWKLFNDLIEHGAEKPEGYCEPESCTHDHAID